MRLSMLELGGFVDELLGLFSLYSTFTEIDKSKDEGPHQTSAAGRFCWEENPRYRHFGLSTEKSPQTLQRKRSAIEGYVSALLQGMHRLLYCQRRNVILREFQDVTLCRGGFNDISLPVL